MTTFHSQPLITKLECFAALSADDGDLLKNLAGSVKRVEARQALSREGSAPPQVVLLVEGLACRSKRLPDGRRQIMSFMLPGDLSDFHTFIPRVLDHGAETVSRCTIMEIARQDLAVLMARPAIAEGMQVSAITEEAIVKEWLVNVGRRTSAERVAHLLCEFLFRLRAIGLAEGDSFIFPASQTDLADSTCLSVVHVNRILQDFRDAGLIRSEGDRLAILDAAALQRAGGFSEEYLELGKPAEAPRHNGLRPSDPQPPV